MHGLVDVVVEYVSWMGWEVVDVLKLHLLAFIDIGLALLLHRMCILYSIKIWHHWHRLRNLITMRRLIVFALRVPALLLQLAVLATILVVKATFRIDIILLTRFIWNILFDELLILVKSASSIRELLVVSRIEVICGT